MNDVTPVGAPTKQFNRYLAEDDPCFGQHYSSRAKACKACTAPVVVGGRLYVLSEVCEARCKGSNDPGQLRRLTSREVLQRLESGATVEEIYQAILNGADPRVAAQHARNLLANRLRYIRREWELPAPEVPPTEELRQDV